MVFPLGVLYLPQETKELGLRVNVKVKKISVKRLRLFFQTGSRLIVVYCLEDSKVQATFQMMAGLGTALTGFSSDIHTHALSQTHHSHSQK